MDARAKLDAIYEACQQEAKRCGTELRRIPTLIAVSKTVAPEQLTPFLEVGHLEFGENRVQEAKAKWPELRAHYRGIRLHLIGPLQSNKVAEAVELFDVIHTLDREKLARALQKEFAAQGRQLPCFIQVNTGEEPQKAGVMPGEADDFIGFCREELKLPVVGLMCIPPAEQEPAPHFAWLADKAKKHVLQQLSMGMSADYAIAAALGATHIRVGSALFGAR